MSGTGGTRRIAGLIAVAVVGYSRLMAADESGTLACVLALRREIVEPAVAAQHGRLFKHMGDRALAEFPSDVLSHAVRGAVLMGWGAVRGRDRELRRGASVLRRWEPFLSVEGFVGQFRADADRATLHDLLRRTGL